jgi:hypothetical protein
LRAIAQQDGHDDDRDDDDDDPDATLQRALASAKWMIRYGNTLADQTQ